jgi:hypothetical protein
MTNCLCSSLSRLALPLLLLSPALVLADTVTTFDVSGTAKNVSGGMFGSSCAAGATCAFSGTFLVDTTTGTVESSSLAFSFPEFPVFFFLASSMSSGKDWEIIVDTGPPALKDVLDLVFTTAPTPGSLKGFTGGSIVGDPVTIPEMHFTGYNNLGGTITPTPEPSSLVPLAGGIGWLVFGLVRRVGKRSAIH